MWLVRVVIRRYIDILIIIINFPYSTCVRSFFGSSILTSLFIFKCFFGLCNMVQSLKFITQYKIFKYFNFLFIEMKDEINTESIGVKGGRQLSQMSAETTVCTKLVAEEAKVLMAPEE